MTHEPNTQGASWREAFKRNVAQLHRKTDYAGEKLPRGAFGYRTEVDWDAVEEFIEQEVASKERAEGERRGREKALEPIHAVLVGFDTQNRPAWELFDLITATLPADSTEGNLPT